MELHYYKVPKILTSMCVVCSNRSLPLYSEGGSTCIPLYVLVIPLYLYRGVYVPPSCQLYERVLSFLRGLVFSFMKLGVIPTVSRSEVPSTVQNR